MLFRTVCNSKLMTYFWIFPLIYSDWLMADNCSNDWSKGRNSVQLHHTWMNKVLGNLESRGSISCHSSSISVLQWIAQTHRDVMSSGEPFFPALWPQRVWPGREGPGADPAVNKARAALRPQVRQSSEGSGHSRQSTHYSWMWNVTCQIPTSEGDSVFPSHFKNAH